MKKILFYINSLNYGGAERVVCNLANQFAAHGYSIVLVTSFKCNREYETINNVKRMTLEVQELRQSFLRRNLSRSMTLRRICKNEAPDLVISFMGENNFRAIIATRFLGIKTIVSVRNDPNIEYSNRLFKLAVKILYPMSDGFVFQTEEAKAWFSNCIQKKSKIILNQVDSKFFTDDGFNGEKRNVVTVGRLEPAKNQKLLIKAFANIAEKFPNENLIIYGDGKLYEELLAYTKELNISCRVVFKGFVEDLLNELQKAKLFVLSSDYEGLPNALMEAMVLGIPTISTDCPCGGPRYLIKNGEDGILFPVGNVEALTNAITTVLCDEKLRNRLSLNAKTRSKEFSPDVVFKAWEDYVEEIVNPREGKR